MVEEKDIVNGVIKDLPVQPPVVLDTVQDEQPKEDTKSDEQNSVQTSKENAAFAQMRIENKELRSRIAALETQLNKENTQTKTTATEGNLLEKRIQKLEEELTNTRNMQMQESLYQQLDELRSTYNLTVPELQEFAELAQKQGYNLAVSRNIMGVYRSLYFDKLVQKEVERTKLELAKTTKSTTPVTGPTVNNKTQTDHLSVDALIEKIAAERLKK